MAEKLRTNHISVPEIWYKRGNTEINQALLAVIEERAAKLGRNLRIIVEVDNNDRTYYKIVDGKNLSFETGVIIIHEPRTQACYYELIEVSAAHSRVAKVKPMDYEPGLCHIDDQGPISNRREEIIETDKLNASGILRWAILNIIR